MISFALQLQFVGRWTASQIISQIDTFTVRHVEARHIYVLHTISSVESHYSTESITVNFLTLY